MNGVAYNLILRQMEINNFRKSHFLLTLLISLFLSCCAPKYKIDEYDDDFIPYNLAGLDVYVYNNEDDKEYYGGRITGEYKQRQSMIDECNSLAVGLANYYHFDNWGYVCCTVTKNSNCVTKIR
jgi:hypothetical protein